MIRIFTTLASFAALFMAATLLVGLYVGDLHANPNEQTLRWATVHRLSGVAAALVVVLVNSIVMTYFIGTSRWVKEVVETYSLDLQFIRRSTLLKRRAFPWAVGSMLVVVGVSALGAAADPGALGKEIAKLWVTPHLFGAMAGLAFIGWSFWMESQYIVANHQVIEDVMREVRRIRTERGLDIT